MAFVIGTAGHIDHGKTALVKALTGIDTDRLKEEKARGITIELGFAHLDLSSEGVRETVGVVDVPGHERFVRAMVAGAVGIDLVVLVVAADEGVMPQTREHLDILRLLDVKRGVVALTKVDLVEPELRALAIEDVRETLAGSLGGGVLPGAPIVPCSSVTGEGLAELRRAIAEGLEQARPRDPEGLLRLPLDRVFSMKGFGTVVTGTLWAGRLKVGDEVEVLPGVASSAGDAGGMPSENRGLYAPHAKVAGKVRGVQVHGLAVEEARAGQRTACNLPLPKELLARGQTLVHAGTLVAGRLLDVRLRYLSTSRAPLRRRSRVLVHAGTCQTLATASLLDRGELLPGGEALAQLHLDHPLVALPGDRFILRGFGLQKEHRSTVGGGTVLRVLGPRHRRGTPALVADLLAAEAATEETRVALEVSWAGASGLARDELQMRLGATPHEVDASIKQLLQARALLRFDRERMSLVHRDVFEELGRRVLAIVDAFHEAEPLRPGIAREALRTQLGVDVSTAAGAARGPGAHRVAPSPKVLHLLFEALVQEGSLADDRELARRPGHSVARTGRALGMSQDVDRVLAHFRAAALSPPRPAEVTVALKLDDKAVKEAIDLLVRGGSLMRIQDLIFASDAVAALREKLVATLKEKKQINAQEWKDLVGASRKYTIPLAEHFDAERVTLRVGDIRRLR